MVFQLEAANGNARELTQSVVQAMTQLTMYNAELARVLHINCADVGPLVNARQLLIENTTQWRQAELFIEFYRLLFEYTSGDGVAMRHWLRKHNRALGATPHKLIVDDDRLPGVIHYLQQQLES